MAFKGRGVIANRELLEVESAPDYPPNEIRLVLVGYIGTGKSALGSNLLGEEGIFPSSTGADPKILKCSFGQRVLNPKTTLVVVDTPGAFNIRRQEKTEICRVVSMSAPGPHVVIFVVRIGKLADEEIDPLKIFVETFGDKVYQHVIFIFTHKDHLDDERISEVDYINSTPKILREMLRKAGDRYAFINNRANGNELKSQVSAIMQLVDELIRTNNNKYYTNQMYQGAEEKLKAKREEIEDKLKKCGRVVTVGTVNYMTRQSLYVMNSSVLLNLFELSLGLASMGICLATVGLVTVALTPIPAAIVGTVVAFGAIKSFFSNRK